jgi:hypothetical protein
MSGTIDRKELDDQIERETVRCLDKAMCENRKLRAKIAVLEKEKNDLRTQLRAERTKSGPPRSL